MGKGHLCQGNKPIGVRSCIPRATRTWVATILILLGAAVGLEARDFAREIDGHLQRSQVDSALAAALAFGEAHPDSGAPKGLLGMIYAETGRFSEAVAAFRKAIELEPGVEEGYGALAMLHARAGQPQMAVDVLNRGIERCSGSPRLLMVRAAVYGDMGRTGPAAADFEEVIRQEPGNVDAYTNLAMLYGAAVAGHNQAPTVQSFGAQLQQLGIAFVALSRYPHTWPNCRKSDTAFAASLRCSATNQAPQREV